MTHVISEPKLKAINGQVPVSLTKLKSRQVYGLLIDEKRRIKQVKPAWTTKFDLAENEWALIVKQL